MHRYWDLASCQACGIKAQCTPSRERRIRRWEHEAVSRATMVSLDFARRIASRIAVTSAPGSTALCALAAAAGVMLAPAAMACSRKSFCFAADAMIGFAVAISRADSDHHAS